MQSDLSDLFRINIRRMIIIETERLILEEASINDAPFFLKLLNTPTWIEYIGDRGVRSIEDAEKYIQKSFIQSYKDNGFGLYKLLMKSENTPIGTCGIIKRSNLEHPDIGFALLPEYAGQGYGFEAASATIEYARSVLQLETILGITVEENQSSRKLLEKIGLKLKGTVPYKETDEILLLYST